MQRRDMLRMAAALGAGGWVSGVFGADDDLPVRGPKVLNELGEPNAYGQVLLHRQQKQALLSRHGCGRATGYAEANKIVTHDGKTHVAWLDSVKGEGFRVRIRTLDRASSKWSQTYTIGEAFDNHGGPALAIDSKGHLIVAYYPHHHPMRVRRSVRPNDASAWTEPEHVGKRATYPTLMVGHDDTLYLTCRESVGDGPWGVTLYTKRPGGEWASQTLLRARFAGYSHYQEALAWGPDHKTLHLSCRIYEGDKPQGRHQTVGYMFSRDAGKTWRRSDETVVDLPATAETIDVIDSIERTDGRVQHLRCGAIAVDELGRPVVVYSGAAKLESDKVDLLGDVHLAKIDLFTWKRRSLGGMFVTEQPRWNGWGVTMPGGVSISPAGEMTVAMTAFRCEPADVWGHPSSEVVVLQMSAREERLDVRGVTVPNEHMPRWLPNVERSTGFNRAARPSLIYTDGARGRTNKDILSNGVYWVG